MCDQFLDYHLVLFHRDKLDMELTEPSFYIEPQSLKSPGFSILAKPTTHIIVEGLAES